VINALCVDVEHWYHNEFLTRYLPEKKEDQVAESVYITLKLLERLDVKATFFILGMVAEEHPEIVRAIFDRGHEIASHAYSHRMLSKLDRREFEQEMVKSIALLEGITGERPLGFRAASFSLTNDTRWALEVLAEYGFQYDASICPVRTILYGVPGAPLFPYRPSLTDITREDPDGKLLEFPMSIFRLGISIPASGGFYFRAMPLWLTKAALRSINTKGKPALFYIHSWELNPRRPRLENLPLLSRFEAYCGMKSTAKKFEHLLQSFQFAPVREVLGIASSG